MQIPLEVTFRNVERSPATEALIRRRAGKLERLSGRIVSCRFAVDRPHAHPRSGSPYGLRLEVTLPPGRDLVVRREPSDGDLHEDLVTLIGDAFDAMERRLERASAKDSGKTRSIEGEIRSLRH